MMVRKEGRWILAGVISYVQSPLEPVKNEK